MKMLIDSQWVNASDGAVREVINPASGERLDDVPEATAADAVRAVEAAQAGKLAMRKLPAAERSRLLFAVAERMQAEKEDLSRLLASENGKPIIQTREEVAAAIRIWRGFAEEAKRLLGQVIPMDAIPGQEKNFAFTIRQPVGVVVAIVPFNYPVELYAHKGAAALAAGNAVICKPPEDCPLSLLRLAQFIEDAGFPRAAHQVVTGRGEVVGETLVAHPGTHLITLTGSVAAGKRVSVVAAEHLKKVHLELGGNDAAIVCADADLEHAAEAVVMGRLARGNGQICCAVKRVFVDQKVIAEFTAILTRKAVALKTGSQLLEDTDVGPLINVRAAQRVESAIQEAVLAGATVSTGGTRDGAFIHPTILTNVPADSNLFYEETFGPVVPVAPFTDIAEAVAAVNHSPYGLQAAIFTHDLTTAFDVAHQLEVGGVVVNWGSAVRMETLPFGGLKLSGHGRESLYETLNDMTELKTIFFKDVLPTYWQP